MYIFLWVIASTRKFYMLFALLVFVVTVGCIVGIRWERWSFFDPVLPYDTSHDDYCSYKRCFHVKQLPESHESGPSSNPSNVN
tara:strand:+ start:371 stop:619 length:249 start_codon:yes stop_codon:yes gene_type:complete